MAVPLEAPLHRAAVSRHTLVGLQQWQRSSLNILRSFSLYEPMLIKAEEPHADALGVSADCTIKVLALLRDGMKTLTQGATVARAGRLKERSVGS